MRYLYYCNSAYQLLNAINLHNNRLFNNYENIDDYEGDLLLLDVFNGSKEIVTRLQDNQVFSKVFLGNRVYKKGKFHLIQNIIDIIFPSQFIYKANGIKKEEIHNKYDYIVVPKFSTITAAIWKMNNRAKLQLYEDGLGIYANEVSLNPNSNAYKYLYKFFNYGRTFNDYENLYLNVPSLYVGNKDRVKQMPKIEKKELDYLSSLFKDFSFGINGNKKLMWFDQYVNDNINDITKKILLNYRQDVVYCTHPRHPKEYKEFDVPNKKQIWELACLELENINSMCLLSIYSTAVFTPKILYGFEPYIILTIKLTNDYKENKFNNFIDVIDRFRNMYSDKTKIMIPDTIEEYEKCIANFINEK